MTPIEAGDEGPTRVDETIEAIGEDAYPQSHVSRTRGANPTLTIVALGLRLAAHLRPVLPQVPRSDAERVLAD